MSEGKVYNFVVVVCPDQSEKDGGLEIDHIKKKLNSMLYFSDRFDLKVDSNLKKNINNVREQTFEDVLAEQNESLPEGTPKYILGRPKLVPSLSYMRGKVVVPLELKLELAEGDTMDADETGNIPALVRARVVAMEILGSRMCNYPQPYSSWRECGFGSKRAFFKKIEKLKKRNSGRPAGKTNMQEAYEKAAAANE